MLFRSLNAANSAGVSLLTGPAFTYTLGILTRIDYDGGQFKILAYNSNGSVNTIQLTAGGSTLTKTFNYNAGVLTGITES